jgi:hypothetical protein
MLPVAPLPWVPDATLRRATATDACPSMARVMWMGRYHATNRRLGECLPLGGPARSRTTPGVRRTPHSPRNHANLNLNKQGGTRL